MTAELTRTTLCPHCGAEVIRPRTVFGGREIFANARPACDPCAAALAAQQRADEADRRWHHALRTNLPERYRAAVDAEVRPQWTAALAWNGTPSGGIGLVGPSGSGKSSALACVVRRLRRPFLWWSGTEARDASLAALTAERNREAARGRWEAAMAAPILVLDDISQGKFTESWASALFDLLETRLSRNLPTLWTSQTALHELRAKISRQAGDDQQAAAICRRLEQHSSTLHCV